MIKKILNNKKLLLTIAILLIVAIIVFCALLLNEKKLVINIINQDGIQIQNEFEVLNDTNDDEGRKYPEVDIPKDNILEYTTISEVLNIFNSKDDAVIYFGYPSCAYCRNAIQVLVDTAKKTELDVLYYLNIDEDDKSYDELMTALGSDFIIETEGSRKVYMPLVIFIVDGDIVSYNKGTLFSQEDPYVPLDDSQVEGLSEIYRYGINDVVSSKKLKGNLK